MNPDDLRVHEQAFIALIEARRMAAERVVDIWQFAIDIDFLLFLGARSTDVRVWKAAGIIEVGDETTPRDSVRRTFSQINQRLPKERKRPVCILSDSGLAMLRQARMDPFEFKPKRSILPRWYSASCELRFVGQLIKRFRWDAPNQLVVLQAFEDQGWPDSITDVFPKFSKVDHKRRLHDTIKCLNRRQRRNLVRFHGDGTGLGVLWRVHGPDEIPAPKRLVVGDLSRSLTLGRE